MKQPHHCTYIICHLRAIALKLRSVTSPSSWPLSAFADEAAPDTAGQIAALQRAGLSLIDLRNVDGFNIAELPLDGARKVRASLDAANIGVGMFGTPLGKIDITAPFEPEVRKLQHMGELAPLLGCTALRIFSYYNRDGHSHEEWQAESLRRLHTLRYEARNLGLTLYHENERHIFGDLCADVETLAAELRDDAFKFIFDFDNYNQSGENVWENWLRLRDVTDAIHLKDSRDGQHVPVGQGAGFVREIIADAVARGWSGPLSVEPHLSHSGAVALTGPSGVANEQFGKLPPAESFYIACETATQLLREAGAPLS